MKIDKFKNIAIVAPFSPDMYGGGAEVLREILSTHPSDKLIWINTNKQVQTNRWWRLDVNCFEPSINLQRGFHIKYWKFSYKYFFRHIERIYITSFVSKIIKKNKIDLVWIISDYSLLNSASLLSKQLKVPYHISVHDDPSFSSEIFGDYIPKRNVEKYFTDIMKKSKSMDVISQNMSNLYKETFGKDSIVITKGFDLANLNKSDKSVSSKKDLKILMAGVSVNTKPWPEIMFDTLDYFNDISSTKLHFYAFDKKIGQYNNPNVSVCGNMSVEEHKAFVESMDLGYANDPLDHSEGFAMTSMPTKIITYISYGIPFIYHGPSKAAIGDIIKEYSLGVHVQTNETNDIIEGFNELIKNYEFYSKNCIVFAENNYDINKIRTSFYNLINSYK